jgi:hypothetical protein
MRGASRGGVVGEGDDLGRGSAGFRALRRRRGVWIPSPALVIKSLCAERTATASAPTRLARSPRAERTTRGGGCDLVDQFTYPGDQYGVGSDSTGEDDRFWVDDGADGRGNGGEALALFLYQLHGRLFAVCRSGKQLFNTGWRGVAVPARSTLGFVQEHESASFVLGSRMQASVAAVQGQERDLAGASVRSAQKVAPVDDASAHARPDSYHREGP